MTNILKDYNNRIKREYLEPEELRILKDIKDNQDKYFELPIGEF